MSVIMTMWVKGDPDKLEKYSADNPGKLRSIADAAEKHGLIAHRFYGADGQILVVDEWPDAESFQKFFDEQQAQIGPMIEAVGGSVAGPPNFWRELKTDDIVGWEESRGR